jgi:hypothetical protein
LEKSGVSTTTGAEVDVALLVEASILSVDLVKGMQPRHSHSE